MILIELTAGSHLQLLRTITVPPAPVLVAPVSNSVPVNCMRKVPEFSVPAYAVLHLTLGAVFTRGDGLVDTSGVKLQQSFSEFKAT